MTHAILASLLFVLYLVGSGTETRPETDASTLRGYATFYDDGPGRYGAAGPVLRQALGGDPAFRGKRVTVCASRCTTVVLSDWCACGPRHGEPTLIDLSVTAFRDIAPLSRGVVHVRISVGGSAPAIPLPETDTE